MTGRGATAARAASGGGGRTGGEGFMDVDDGADGSEKGSDEDWGSEVGCGLLEDGKGSEDRDWDGEVVMEMSGGADDDDGSEAEGGRCLVEDVDAEGSEDEDDCFLEEEDLEAVLVEEDVRPLLEEADEEAKAGSEGFEEGGGAAVDVDAEG